MKIGAMFLFSLVADGELKAKWPGFKPVYMHGADVPARGACGFFQELQMEF